MKAQIRAKSRIRGRDWTFFTVRMKNKGAENLIGLMSEDALRLPPSTKWDGRCRLHTVFRTCATRSPRRLVREGSSAAPRLLSTGSAVRLSATLLLVPPPVAARPVSSPTWLASLLGCYPPSSGTSGSGRENGTTIACPM
jgi:hypothetical protein